MSLAICVEEEFMLFGATPRLAPAGGVIVETATAYADGRFEHELKREQAEARTSVPPSLSDLDAVVSATTNGSCHADRR